jgi:hypothetical protein
MELDALGSAVVLPDCPAVCGFATPAPDPAIWVPLLGFDRSLLMRARL